MTTDEITMSETKLKSGFSTGTEGRYSNLLDLKEFFAGAEDYVILKLSDEFPNYRDYSDVDILCRDRKNLLNHVLTVGRRYEQRGFRIETVQKGESLHIDFFAPGAEKLNFRFDLLDKLTYRKFDINPGYADIVLGNRQQVACNGVNIYVPSLQHDLAIRFFEYIEWHDTRPEKIKHLDYINKHKCSDFVDVVNKYTDLNISVEKTNGTINLKVSKKNEHIGRLSTIQNSVTVEGIEFSDVRPTKCLTNSVGFNSGYIIKIEHQPNPKKLRNIVQEAEIIKYLNDCGCVSCPKLHSVGRMPGGENYIIMERLHQNGLPALGDMIFSLIEQKNLGVYQGDFKPENTVFDGSVCYLIDYDQAQKDDRFRQMGNIEFIDWMAEDFRQRRGHDFFTDSSRNFDKQQIYGLFVNDSFDMKNTAVFKKQITTNTESGIYHNFSHPKIFIKGARGLEDRICALNKIEFNRDETVLDVGCNMGLLSHYLHDKGCRVCGVDMDKNIIMAAMMVSNIISKNIEFRFCDIDKQTPAGYFDTICLFSVLHHLQNMKNAVEYISTHCGRIVLEARLKEGGSKPVNGKWTPTSSWNYKDLDEMVAASEKLFAGFHFDKLYGQCDRNRFILSLVNPHNTRLMKTPVVPERLLNSDDSDKKERIDYFLIWGHGLAYTKQILEIIRNNRDFDIISITKKSVRDIGKFVEDIYSCDSVPFEHLVAKTRYLLKTPPEINFILLRNKNAQEKYFGEGPFRHIQCQLIKNVKEEIRNRFNPRINGKRTEEHVIHASDYESQVEHVLKVLDLPPLAYYTRQPNRDLDVPFHIEPFDDYHVKEIDIDSLYANILADGVVQITQTPHYKYLTGDRVVYLNYHKQYFGKQLTDDHFPEAYDLMLSNFKYDYITKDGRRSLILAKAIDDNKYQILDGVHRAAVLKHQGAKTVTIAEPVYGVKQHINQQNSKKCDIAGLIFSKDRALQLQATIESFLLHCRDQYNIYLTVLYKASHELYAGQYAELKSRFPGVNFVEESSFREQVLSVLEKCDYILFLVDDNIFTRHFCISDITAALAHETDTIGLSLRLGENTTYCYMKGAIQRQPQFEKVTDYILKYDWTSSEHDYNYPLEVSSSVYRSKEIAGFLSGMDFSNPNTLEVQMTSAEQFKQTRPKLLCYHTSVTFCNPVNKVQNVYEQNRSGTNEKYSSERLSQIYQQGMVVDAGKYAGFMSNGVHQEVNLYFKKAGDNAIGISVIIPCYNHAHYLPETVASIVNQTYKNWECIIVNDCSTDNTAEVAGQLIEKYPNHKIRLINKPQNTGLADTRNTAISAAVNEWILPLDSDDMFEPTFMQKAVYIIQQEQKVDIVFANLQEFGASSGKWIPAAYSKLQLMLENTMPYASLYRKELWRKVGGYDNLLSIIIQPEDWNFWMSCLKYNPVVRRINEALFLYRVNPQSMYHKTIKGNLMLAWAFIVTCHPDLYPVTSHVLAWQKIANCSDGTYENIIKAVEKYPEYGLAYFWRGLRRIRMGQIREAIEDYRMAVERAKEGDWQASFALMTLQKSRGDLAGARRSLENLLNIRPDYDWARDMFSSRASQQKILFYYDMTGNIGETSPAGTVTAVLNFAEMLGNNSDMEIHITGDHVHYPEQYGSLHIIPLPPTDKRGEFLAYYDVVFFATHVRYFKGLTKPPGQIWILWQHCWNADDLVSLSYMSDFDIVGCLSELHRASLRNQGIGDEKFIILPNLIDTGIYSPKAVGRNSHSIMYAGALHEHKCVQILIDAFRLVRRQINDAELHIYGDGLMWRGGNDYGDNLKRTKPEGTYFHGYVNNKDMPEIYSKHSILCLPSKYETFPMVILESQACGCIPVAHNAGGTAATVSDGQTGLLYSPNTPENLAETIVAAFRIIDTDPSIRHRAVNFIRENFSVNRVPEYISKLWDRINIAGEVNSIRMLLENNTELADLKCEQLSQKCPNHPEVLLLQAMIMNLKGNGLKANTQIRELLEKYPNYVRALNDYGLMAMKAGETKNAIGFFTKAYKFNQWDKNTITNCYKVLKTSGNYEQAKLLLLNYLTTIGVDSRILDLLGEIDALIANEGSAVNLVSQQPVNNKQQVHCPDSTSKPLISIIMPVYNGADHIGQAIESVLSQNYANFELVIVDDGSTDNTKEVVLRYNDDHINCIYKENGGVASARNFGVRKARGSFIIMLDSDDMMTPDYIARHLQVLQQHPESDMIYCDELLINEQDKPLRLIKRPEYSDQNTFVADLFRSGFPVVHFKTFIKRSVFDKIGPYDERLIIAEDYDMIRRFAKNNLRMVHLPEALYLRRLTGSGISRTFNAEKAKSHFDVVRRFTETFTPEQLFPDVRWDELPAGQKSVLAKCKTALVYLGIAEQYVACAPDYAATAFEMANSELDDCCKIEPDNREVRNLREKCRSISTARLTSGSRGVCQPV